MAGGNFCRRFLLNTQVNIPTDKKIILFDGVCNLCNRSVQFILRRDKKNQFVFGSLQGQTGRELLTEFNMPVTALHTFVLVENGKVYLRSTAALRVLRYLGGGWQLFYAFMVVPRFVRDGIYNLISRNRYKWFGKNESCMIPDTKWEPRFLV